MCNTLLDTNRLHGAIIGLLGDRNYHSRARGVHDLRAGRERILAEATIARCVQKGAVVHILGLFFLVCCSL